MSITRTILALGAAALIAASTGCHDQTARAQPNPEKPLAPRLERETPYPELTRKLLHDRMSEHKTSMKLLLSSALVLDHARTESLATDLASTPAIPREVKNRRGPTEQLIRERFATYQVQMRERAGELAAAARERDSQRVARAYGRLTEVCVGCHAAYLAAPVKAKRKVPHRR